MSEKKEIIGKIIERGMERIGSSIDNLANKIVKFMAWKEAVDPDREYVKVEVPELHIEEEVLQDLETIVVMAKTDKAILVVKNGHQKWVPLSFISEEQKIEEKGFTIGSIYDIKLLDDKGWILDKGWEKYVPQKGGK